MAIFMTGDTHGDFSRLRPVAFREQGGLTKDDYLIICGDFGGVWDGSEIEQQWLDWLENRSFTTLFVSGNHENYDMLRNYPTSEWHGGLVQPIRPSVLHLMRGQLYEICGKKIFTMGGASSHDIRDGILEPDDPNYERKLRQLNAAGGSLPNQPPLLVERGTARRGRIPDRKRSTGQNRLGRGLHHHPLLPQQHSGHIQRRAVPTGCPDRLSR